MVNYNRMIYFHHFIIYMTLHNLFYQDHLSLLVSEWSQQYTCLSNIQELLFYNIIFYSKIPRKANDNKYKLFK